MRGTGAQRFAPPKRPRQGSFPHAKKRPDRGGSNERCERDALAQCDANENGKRHFAGGLRRPPCFTPHRDEGLFGSATVDWKQPPKRATGHVSSALTLPHQHTGYAHRVLLRPCAQLRKPHR